MSDDGHFSFSLPHSSRQPCFKIQPRPITCRAGSSTAEHGIAKQPCVGAFIGGKRADNDH
eukprot:scaffold1079_cov191-Amphora_coffeaeformis.AAC.3